MNKSSLLHTLLPIALFLTLIAAPCAVVGQHGGHGGGGSHGGGGGFHGGGGGHHGGGYYGGGSYHAGGGYRGGAWGGGYHGGGWNGYHSGGYYRGGWHGRGYYGGWRGGYYPTRGWYGWGGWGYPGWGWNGWGWGGWGFGIGVSFGWGAYGGWGGYWPAYPYDAYPVPGPVYYPCDQYYPYATCVSAGDPPATPAVPASTASYAQPSRAPYNPDDYPTYSSSASVAVKNAAYRPYVSPQTDTSDAPSAHSNPQLSDSSPAVQNVIRALRAMPPAARERQLASGRYDNFSPQEIEYIRDAANVPE